MFVEDMLALPGSIKLINKRKIVFNCLIKLLLFSSAVWHNLSLFFVCLLFSYFNFSKNTNTVTNKNNNIIKLIK